MTATLSPGTAVRVPAGSDIWPDNRGIHAAPSRSRKERLGVVEFDLGDGLISFVDRAGRHPITRVEHAQVIAEGNHTLSVRKFKRGGHPIAGWNWPIWGYDYRCSCGESVADREDHGYHLEALAESA